MSGLLRAGCLVLCAAWTAAGAEDAAPPAAAETPPPAAANPEDADKPPDEKRLRRSALAGLFALAGIALAGAALVVLVMVWARRLRRLNRDAVGATRLEDEFWFLRPPKPKVPESLPEDRERLESPGDSA